MALPAERSIAVRWSPFAYLILAPLLWSGNFLFGKFLSQQIDPFTLSLLRWALAAAVLVPLCWHVAGLRLPARRDWPAFATLGLTGVFAFNALVYLSLRYTSAVSALLINAAIPVATLILAYPLGGIRPRARQWAGSVLSLIGVGVVITRGSVAVFLGLRFNAGDLIMLADTLVWGAYTLVGQKVMRRYTPLETTTWSILAGLPPLVLASAVELALLPPPHLTALGMVGVLYIGILAAAIAFLAWFAGVAAVGSARAASFANLLPIFGVLAAALFLGERVSAADLAGGVLTVAGVYLAAQAVRPSPRGRAPEELREDG